MRAGKYIMKLMIFIALVFLFFTIFASQGISAVGKNSPTLLPSIIPMSVVVLVSHVINHIERSEILRAQISFFENHDERVSEIVFVDTSSECELRNDKTFLKERREMETKNVLFCFRNDEGLIDERDTESYLFMIDHQKLVLTENLMFNEIAKEINNEFVMLLNSNSVPIRSQLRESVSILRGSDVAVVGGKLINKDNEIETVGKSIHFNDEEFVFYETFSGFDLNYRRESERIICINKEGMILKLSEFRNIKGFSDKEEFDMLDMCLSLKKFGKNVRYFHENIFRSRTTDNSNLRFLSPEMKEFEEELFFQKWRGFLSTVVLQSFELFTNVFYDFGGGGCSGWFVECINFMVSLQGKVKNLRVISGKNDYCEGLPKYFSETADRLIDRNFTFEEKSIFVSHKPMNRYPNFDVGGYFGSVAKIPGRPDYIIGRTMIEKTTLPYGWDEKWQSVNEIWVPSNHVWNVFVRGGVPEEMLFLVPETLDHFYFDPAVVEPFQFPMQYDFTFLSIFKWEDRKGPTFLIESFVSEFSSFDSVQLVVLTYPYGYERKKGIILSFIEDIIVQLDLKDEDIPHIEVICPEIPLPMKDIPRLYKAADAFVLPTRGEGWCLPCHESLLMATPVIATNFSGHLDFLDETNSFLVEIEEMENVSYWENDGKWAKPSVASIRRQMRRAFENQEGETREKGKNGRNRMVEEYSMEKVSNLIVSRLRDIEVML